MDSGFSPGLTEPVRGNRHLATVTPRTGNHQVPKAEMTDNRPPTIGEGIKTGIGILTAFKEAIEETLNEAIARGDVSPERAKSLMKDAAERVQTAAGEARERLDLVSRREFETLRGEVEELRRRLDAQQARAAETPASSTTGETGGIPVD